MVQKYLGISGIPIGEGHDGIKPAITWALSATRRTRSPRATVAKDTTKRMHEHVVPERPRLADDAEAQTARHHEAVPGAP